MPVSPRQRLGSLLLAGSLAVALILGYGRAMDNSSLSLAECVKEPVRCEGAELYLGYATVMAVSDRTVSLKSWMGPVQVTPWPGASPLPSPGLSVSVIGEHAGGTTVTPHRVQAHPFRRVKEATGAVMLLAWALGVAAWTRARWIAGPGARRA